MSVIKIAFFSSFQKTAKIRKKVGTKFHFELYVYSEVESVILRGQKFRNDR